MKITKNIHIVPDKIEFYDIEPGYFDEIEVFVHNIGKKPMQIRFSVPQDSPFTIPPNKPGLTPPGLEVKTIVRYSPFKNCSKNSKLFIHTNEMNFDIPISIVSHHSKLSISSTKLDLQTIGLNETISHSFFLNNSGNIDTSVIVTSESPFISILTSKIIIMPNSQQEVFFTILPNIIGSYSDEIILKSEKNSNINEKVVVKYKVINQSLELRFNGKFIQELSFDTIYFGQKKVLIVEIYNPSNIKRSFVIKRPYDPKNPSNQDLLFSSIPIEGQVKPKESIPISFIFSPKDPGYIDNIETLYHYISQLEVVETSQTIQFQINGIAVPVTCSLSSVEFIFGKHKVNTKVSQPLLIKNNSLFLPINFSCNNTPQFHFIPNKGLIKINSTFEIKVEFNPHNLGEFDLNSTISLNEGLSNLNVHLTGESVQNNESNIFRRTPIWEVDPDADYAAKHPDQRYGLSFDEIQNKQKKNSIFHQYILDHSEIRHEKLAKKELIDHLHQKAEIFLKNTKNIYTNEEIEEIVKQELSIWSADDSITLGFSSAEGLQEPDPPKFPSNPPIFIAEPSKLGLVLPKSKDGSNNYLETSRSLSQSLPNRFKSQPTTPPEIKECSKPLTPTQQLGIIISHQTLNFGTVSVLSTETRQFTITNSLQQYIFVQFFHEHDELKKSSPNSQVIPPLQTAEFDILFSSKNQSNFMKPLKFTINNIHKYTLNISAQVIPIDVKLSKSVLNFSLPKDILQIHSKETIILSNQSNSYAEYKWNGFSDPFFVSRETGIIDPKSSISVEIIYQPGFLPHSELVVSLSIIGGPSRALKCIGDIGKIKMSINKKNVDFGMIPISSLKLQQIKLKNSGPDDAIFTIGEPEINIFKISPSIGRLTYNETKSIDISIDSPTPGQFSIPITINICGSNPLTFNVNANAQLPSVDFEYSNLDYGKVFVGGSSSKKFIIKNSGQIPAILFLDLKSQTNFSIEYSSELGLSNSNDTSRNSISLVPLSEISTSTSEFRKLAPSPSRKSLTLFPDLAKEPTIYKFIILENSFIEFQIHFKPKNIGDFSFEIPFKMAKKTLKKLPFIIAEAIHAPLVISSSTIDFGISPLYDSNNPNSRSIIREIVLKNEHNSTISYKFENNEK